MAMGHGGTGGLGAARGMQDMKAGQDRARAAAADRRSPDPGHGYQNKDPRNANKQFGQKPKPAAPKAVVPPVAPTFPGNLTPDFIKSALSRSFWGDQGAPLGPTSFGGGMAAAQQSPAGGPVLPPPVAQMAAGSPLASQPGPLPGVPQAPISPGAPPPGAVNGPMTPGRTTPLAGAELQAAMARRMPTHVNPPRPTSPPGITNRRVTPPRQIGAGRLNPFLQQVGFGQR